MKTQFSILDSDFALDTIAPRGRIGVIALATDFNLEQDMRRMLPPGVEMFTNRVANSNPLTVDNLRAMQGDIQRAAAGLLPGLGVDVVIYACTSGAAVIGMEAIQQCVRHSHPRAPLTTPLTAAVAAMRAAAAGRISVLTPYSDEINRKIADSLSGEGFEILNIAGFGFDDDIAVTAIPLSMIAAAAEKVCHPTAEALFISCTALRASPVIDEIEKIIRRPVIASNQALAWHALQLLGVRQSVAGFGEILRAPLSGG